MKAYTCRDWIRSFPVNCSKTPTTKPNCWHSALNRESETLSDVKCPCKPARTCLRAPLKSPQICWLRRRCSQTATYRAAIKLRALHNLVAQFAVSPRAEFRQARSPPASLSPSLRSLWHPTGARWVPVGCDASVLAASAAAAAALVVLT